MMTMQQNKRRDMRQECGTTCVLRERNKKKQEKFYRGPRLECERWLWWLELGDGVGKMMPSSNRGGETDPDDL